MRLGSRHHETAKSHGFTLVELITALAVLSVAMGIFVSLFGNSISLARENRNNMIASEIAETQLNLLASHPDHFSWQSDAPDETGLFAILPISDSQISMPALNEPDITLASKKAQDQNSALYRQFHWRAWGRSPSSTANYYEVTVSVHWRSGGRPRMLALTSGIPKINISHGTAPSPSEGGST